MDPSEPIQVVLDSLKAGRKVTSTQIQDALTEFRDRLDILTDENRKKFGTRFISEILANLRDDQKNSAKAKLENAKKEYEHLSRLTQQYREPLQRGYQEIHGSRGKQLRASGTESDHVAQETKTKDRKEEKKHDDRSDRSKIAINDVGKVASFNMKNNPLIADLSDTNRPTKTAERFSELYDNEWTEAYEELIKLLHTEEKVIKILLEVVTDSYKFCKQLADQQIKLMNAASIDIMKTGKPQSKYDESALEDIKDKDRMPLAQYRKRIADLSIGQVKRGFSQKVHQKLHDHILHAQSDRGAFHIYVQKCAEITWWMCVQDPPIAMIDLEGDLRDPQKSTSRKFDQNQYRAYTKSGSTIKYFVWPCLRLHEGGPILCKGVAQAV